MEGKFRYYFANPRVRIQDDPEGSFMNSTVIGPEIDMDEAIQKYYLAYPVEGYATRITYQGNIVSDKGKKERVVVFRRYRTCD